MMLVGVAVAVIWRQAGLSGNLYEVLPGMASGVLVYAIFRLVEPKSVTSH